MLIIDNMTVGQKAGDKQAIFDAMATPPHHADDDDDDGNNSQSSRASGVGDEQVDAEDANNSSATSSSGEKVRKRVWT